MIKARDPIRALRTNPLAGIRSALHAGSVPFTQDIKEAL